VLGIHDIITDIEMQSLGSHLGAFRQDMIPPVRAAVKATSRKQGEDKGWTSPAAMRFESGRHGRI